MKISKCQKCYFLHSSLRLLSVHSTLYIHNVWLSQVKELHLYHIIAHFVFFVSSAESIRLHVFVQRALRLERWRWTLATSATRSCDVHWIDKEKPINCEDAWKGRGMSVWSVTWDQPSGFVLGRILAEIWRVNSREGRVKQTVQA